MINKEEGKVKYKEYVIELESKGKLIINLPEIHTVTKHSNLSKEL